MTVSTYNPADHANHQHTHGHSDNHHGHGNHDHGHHSYSHSHSHAPTGRGDDILRVMPTLNDLQKPHSDQEFIEKAMAEERSNHKNLIASSRDELPSVTVNRGSIYHHTIDGHRWQFITARGNQIFMVAALFCHGFFDKLLVRMRFLQII